MKATEVLNRYANGERDFRRANLRGQSFKGHDLSGADFTEADIRGANFTNAILKEANFTRVKAGVQKRWGVGLLVILSLLSAVLNFSSVYLSTVILLLLFGTETLREATSIPGVLVLLEYAIVLLTIFRQGFTIKAISTIALNVSLAVAIGLITAVAASFATGLGFGVAVFGGITVGIGIAFAVAISVAGNVGIAGIFCVADVTVGLTSSAIAFAGAGIAAGSIAIYIAGIAVGAFAFACAVVSLLLGIYCSFRSLKGDEKFAVIRTFGVALSALGGTSFCGADLTHANFSQALLQRTNFNHTKQRQTVLEWVCWQDVKKLDYARVGNSILVNPAVRELLVTRNGYKKSYVDANLRAVNLDGVNLEQATLRWADLSCSTLRQANLKNAELTEALVVGTNLTGTNLTGACLEDWNISSSTKLEGVDCQYVYLLRNQQERRPSSGDFAPGEFTKLFQEAINTVDLIFRNGVDWKAFVAAFQTVQVDNDGTELTIQSIENKGDGVVVVRVSVPEEADKAKIHGEFNQNYDLALKALEAKYHAELKAKDEQITIYREKSADMTEILRLLANRPVTVEVNASAESKAMTDSTDKSQNINISGSNITGSTINLGAISGSVSNVVSQLPSALDPAQPGIKELLIELQAAIESDADLPEKGKASALEQVKVLAEAAQDPEQPEKKGLGSQAITFFKNAASFLPDTAKLAEACTKLLPLITKALGLPF